MKKIFYLVVILVLNLNCILSSFFDQDAKEKPNGMSNIMLLALGGVQTTTEGNVSSATVTSSGGTVVSEDGKYSLEIPAGALSETSQITVTRNASPIGNIPSGYATQTNVLKFEPAGLVFQKPARLTITYDQGEMIESGFEERSLGFYYIKDDSTLEKMNVVSIDYSQNKLIVEVEHFSFGVGLTIQIWLVNNSIITNSVPVQNIANNVIGELSSYAQEGYSSLSAYFQAHSSTLGPFLNQLVAILGYDPISAAFPNEDFNGNGIPNSEDPYVPSSGPVLSIVSSGSSSVSSLANAINNTQFVWQSSKTGTFSIRAGGTNCTDGSVVSSGSVTAGTNITFGPVSASSLALGLTNYRVCVVSAGVTGSLVWSVTRDDSLPTVSVNPAAGNYGSIQNVALICGDTGGSGCGAVAYTTNGTSPVLTSSCAVTTGTLYTAPIVTPNASITTIKYKSCDKAGNISSLYSQTYTVDTILPSITINSVSPGTTIQAGVSPQINWQSNRDGNYAVKIGSDCSTGIQATGTNVSGTITSGISLTSTISAGSQLTEGSRKINFCVSNMVGNFGSSSSTITVDTVAPTLSITPSSGTYPAQQSITVNCSDATTSCQKVIYTTNGSDPSVDASGTITNGSLYVGSLTTPNGTLTTYKFMARDLAGNLSGISTVSYSIGPPSAPSITSAASGNGKVTVSFASVSGATNYKIYYKTTNAVTKSDSSVSGTSSPIEVTGLLNGTTYYFAITASHNGGESTLSSTSQATPTSSIAVNETDVAAEIDWCKLQHPLTLSVNSGVVTYMYGLVYELTYTDQSTGAHPDIRSDFGYGPTGTDPRTDANWIFAPATFNPDGMHLITNPNDDEYQYAFTAPAAGSYLYTFRFTRDGTNYTYCDTDGAGSNPTLIFSPSALGTLTVN